LEIDQGKVQDLTEIQGKVREGNVLFLENCDCKWATISSASHHRRSIMCDI